MLHFHPDGYSARGGKPRHLASHSSISSAAHRSQRRSRGMEFASYVTSEAPATDAPLVQVGSFPDSPKSLNKEKQKKRRRSESLNDITNCEPKKKKKSGSKYQKKKKAPKEPLERPEASALADEVWRRLQSMMVVTKSLRNITSVTLAFFKEHELAHMQLCGLSKPVYPVVVPVSEVYSMIASRKRRVYDVLHVLEGIGVLKRMNDKASSITRFRGGQFLYFGLEGALTRLQAIRNRSQDISRGFREAYPNVAQHEVDMMLLKASNIQAAIESWPHLAATTVSFLSFVLENDDHSTLLLSAVNQRLVAARIVCDSSISDVVRESLLIETSRRVYDVVSVLASLNIVIMSSLSHGVKKRGLRRGHCLPRKLVSFNKAVFENRSLLRIGTSCSSHLASILTKEKTNIKGPGVVHPDEQATAATKEVMTEDAIVLPSSMFQEETSNLVDLFPDVESSDVATADGMAEWWDVPLRDLLLRDALPQVDFLDWEIMQAISRSRLRTANDQTPFVTSEECDSHLNEDVDLECHEQLPSV